MLETTRSIYLNGNSRDGNKILANFNSSLSENGTMTVNETINESENMDIIDRDFNEFRELAKVELKKLIDEPAENDTVTDEKPVTDDEKTVADSEPVADSTDEKDGETIDK